MSAGAGPPLLNRRACPVDVGRPPGEPAPNPSRGRNRARAKEVVEHPVRDVEKDRGFRSRSQVTGGRHNRFGLHGLRPALPQELLGVSTRHYSAGRWKVRSYPGGKCQKKCRPCA